MEYIIAIGIFQALVAIALLLKYRLHKGADAVLLVLIACIATHLVIKFVIYNFISDTHVRLQMNTFLNLCYGPLLYLYARKIAYPAFIPVSKWYVFIPFVIAMVGYFSVSSVLLVASDKGYKMLDIYNSLTFWSMVPIDIFCCLAAFRLMRNVDKTGKTKEIKLVKQIATAFLAMCIMGVVCAALRSFGIDLNIWVRIIAYSVLLLLCILILRYKLLSLFQEKEKEQLLSVSDINTQASIADASPESPAKMEEVKRHTLSEEEQKEIWHRLEGTMKDANVFTDSTLSLDKLAAQTRLNKYHISETLNSFARKTFYQYINEYRIQFAAQQIKVMAEKELSVNMLSIAYASGFNAKSSFNRYFKEITGQTPTEYLKDISKIAVSDILSS